MKVNVKEILAKQAEWQKSRKTASWGDKIRQSERARDTLGNFGYKASGPHHGPKNLECGDKPAAGAAPLSNHGSGQIKIPVNRV